MKVRQGFVSNSSSSSFMIFGKYYEDLPDSYAECWDSRLNFEDALEDDGIYVGIYPHKLDKNKTIKQSTMDLYDILIKYDPDITLDDIAFHCESGYNG